MKKVVFLFLLFTFATLMEGNANAPENFIKEGNILPLISSLELNNNSATPLKFYDINQLCQPESYEKPVWCGVVIEDENGNQVAGIASGATKKEACDKAYEDAKSQL